MGRLSKAKRKTLAATRARTSRSNSTGPRRIDVVLPALRPLDAPPRGTKRLREASVRYEASERPRKRRRTDSNHEYGRQGSRSDLAVALQAAGVLNNLERKWAAVSAVSRYEREDGTVSKVAMQDVASKAKVKPKTLSRWKARADAGESLVRLEGSGRPLAVWDCAVQSLREAYDIYGGFLSQQALAEISKTACKHTIQRILAGPDWCAVRPRIVPKNTEDHRQARVKFATEYLDEPFGGEEAETLWVDIDEKSFYAFRTGQVCYVPAELLHTVQAIEENSKTAIPSVMFFGAIARPVPSRGFDGRVELRPVAEAYVQQRRSKYAEKGETVFKPITMNKELFIQYCKDLLPTISSIAKKLPTVKKVVVQCDQAGGHGGGRADISNVLAVLNRAGCRRRPPVRFIAQPSRSPDFNALDLGAWHSLSSGVAAVRADPDATQKISDRIIEHVKQRWGEWDAVGRLERIFQSKRRVLRASLEAGGSNQYEMPRSGTSHAGERSTHCTSS